MDDQALAVDVSTPEQAQARAERIRRGMHVVLDLVEEIALAFERRDWQVLGYPDWSAYMESEFGTARLRMPAPHRQKAVAMLRTAAEMSSRAIAAALGVSQSTIRDDLAALELSTSTQLPAPETVRGLDGKVRPATRAAIDPPPDRDPDPSPGPAVATADPAGPALPGGDGPVEETPAGVAAPAGVGPGPAAVVEAACERCGTMTPVDQLDELDEPDDGELRCLPCRTDPPEDYVTTMLAAGVLLPGDYLEHWRGPDGKILGYDLVTRVRAWPTTGRGRDALMLVTTTAGRILERRAVDEEMVRRVPGRTRAAGGVTGCAGCGDQVPVVVTYNDRCPACVTDGDRAAMQQEKLNAQGPGMVPGPEQQLPAARIRAGDLLQVEAGAWQPVTYAEISPEPEGPGEWMVHTRCRKSTQHTATAARTHFWDEMVRIRRPVPGGAEPVAIADEAESDNAGEDDADPPPAAPRLNVEQVGRLRAAYAYARATGWERAPHGYLGRDYDPDDPDDTVPTPRRDDGARVARVDVQWNTEQGDLEIEYRSDRYHLHDQVLRVADVDQALDVLAALGLLPARLSRQYWAGHWDGQMWARNEVTT